MSLLLATLTLYIFSAPVYAQLPCEDEPAFQKLDFWVGEWSVHDAQGQQIGVNRIEEILGGCALLEHWTASDGSEGKSLFYYNPATQTWKQVWVTEQATVPGGLKEKQLVGEGLDGSVQFQGRIFMADGTTYLDRTTLVPLLDGRVRQVIATSSDGGRTWTTQFEALYVPIDTLSSEPAPVSNR